MVTLASPQWIEHLYLGTPGLDHLGLGSVSSDRILPSLSPAINVQTLHPRYHAFYAFLLDEYWRQERKRSRRDWSRFLRARESIFSIGASLCRQPEHGLLSGVVGSQKTASWAHEERKAYASINDYMQSDLGGYGLYYRVPMIQLGWILPGGRGLPYPVDVPTEQGKALAEAFRSQVRQTDYYKRLFSEDDVDVPIKALRSYITQACLCQAQTSDATDRPLLRQAFLTAGEGASARRQTLRLFVDLAVQTDGDPVSEMDFRQLVYFGASENGHRFLPSSGLEDVARRWRLYQAREYYAYALNRLWVQLVEWGLSERGDRQPLSLQSVWAYLDGQLDLRRLTTHLELPVTSLSARSSLVEVMTWLQTWVDRDGSGPNGFGDLNASLQEDVLFTAAWPTAAPPAATVAGMILLLLVVALRFGTSAWRRDPAWIVAQMGGRERLSLDVFLQALEARQHSGSVTLGEIARWIVNDLVIVQHQLIAAAKMPENTYRFLREGDRLRFFDLPRDTGFSDSRFTALSTTLLDLGWCGDFRLADHGPTADGLRLLREDR